MWVSHPVPMGIPVGMGQSPHTPLYTSAQCSQAPILALSNLFYRIANTHWNTFIVQCVQSTINNNPKLVTAQLHIPQLSQGTSQVKLLHSFKQGWWEGSIVSENMWFHTQQNGVGTPTLTQLGVLETTSSSFHAIYCWPQPSHTSTVTYQRYSPSGGNYITSR